MKQFESFIAKRYLLSKHKINFITIISIISITGITIGVAALIVVLSVFNGFGSLVTSFLVSFDPHIQITSQKFETVNFNQAVSLLDANEVVIGHSSFIVGKVLASSAGINQVVNLKGIEISSGKSVYDIEKSIIFGKYDLTEDKGMPKILIGLRLADKLQSIIGDTLTLISPAGIERSITQFSYPQMQRFIISGIYSSKNNEYDDQYIFCALSESQKFFNYGEKIQGIDVRLNNIDSSDKIQKMLSDQLPKNEFTIKTWYDFHKELYTVMQIERWAAYIILSLIIAVACFNILGSLSMSVIEKKRDIGVLRAIGISEKSILRIFVYEGLLIGMAGSFFGAVLGYFVCFLQLKFKVYPLNPLQYKIDAIPVEIHLADFFFIGGMALLLTFLAAYYPAKRAAKINIVESIKWE